MKLLKQLQIYIFLCLSFSAYADQQQMDQPKYQKKKGTKLSMVSDYVKYTDQSSDLGLVNMGGISILVFEKDVIVPKGSENVDIGSCSLKFTYDYIPQRDVVLASDEAFKIQSVKLNHEKESWLYVRQGMSMVAQKDTKALESIRQKASEAGKYILTVQTPAGNILRVFCSNIHSPKDLAKEIGGNVSLLVQEHFLGSEPKI